MVPEKAASDLETKTKRSSNNDQTKLISELRHERGLYPQTSMYSITEVSDWLISLKLL